MARFDGKVALVTGAASGMGRATCVRLTSEGCRVFALDINSSGLEETAEPRRVHVDCCCDRLED